MPGHSIEACVAKEFDRYEFFTLKPPRRGEEGRFTFITYAVDDRTSEPSGVAVVRNYEAAIKAAGGPVAASDPQRWVNGSIVADGKEIWAQAEKGNGRIWLRIVEKQAMGQYVTADAAAFGKDINATGHAALLTGDPALTLWVVGHTDVVDQVTDNMTLSQARAEAVVKAGPRPKRREGRRCGNRPSCATVS